MTITSSRDSDANGACCRAAKSLWSESELPSLDGIRALSCIWVSASHAVFLWQMSASEKMQQEVMQKVYDRWYPIAVACNGDAGVDFFLLLSGYLIGCAVIKEVTQTGSFALTRFFLRRAFRILPIFWLALMLAVLIQGFEVCSINGTWWKKLLLVENIYSSLVDTGRCVPQSWSVALEMQLYLITPPLIVLSFSVSKRLGTTPSQVILSVCMSFWVAFCASRFTVLPAVLAQEGTYWYTGTSFRCAPYFCGVGTAAALVERAQAASPKDSSVTTASAPASGLTQDLFTALASAVLLFFAYFGGGGPLLGFEVPMERYPFGLDAAKLHFAVGRPLIGAAAAHLLWKMLTGRVPRLQTLLASGVWRPLARLSYSAYMMQVISFVLGPALLAPMLSGGPTSQAISALSVVAFELLLFAWVIAYTLFAFAMAVVSYLLLEHPGIALGRRCASRIESRSEKQCDELAKPLV